MFANKKVYIAGKVTGLYRPYVVAKFYLYTWLLQRKGYEVINPVKLVPKTATWHEAMNICLPALSSSEILFVMPNWPNSKGAEIEVKKAYELNIEVINVSIGINGLKIERL